MMTPFDKLRVTRWLRVTLMAFALALALPQVTAAKVLPMEDAMGVIDVVHAHLPNSGDLDVNLVGEPPYAIAWWSAEKGHAGGSALEKKVGKNWTLVKMISGTFADASSLEALGVPASQANALIADLHRH